MKTTTTKPTTAKLAIILGGIIFLGIPAAGATTVPEAATTQGCGGGQEGCGGGQGGCGSDESPSPMAASKTGQKTEFRGDPFTLSSDPVSGQALGAIEKQTIVQHEGRELRFSGEKTAEAFRADPAKYLPGVDEKMIAEQLPFYPLDTCIVTGEKLGGDMGKPVDLIYKNRLVRLCCNGCKRKVLSDPDKYIAKIDQAIIKAQLKDYPLETCPVTGQKLGGMGAPVDLIIGSRLVRLCCNGCKGKVTKDPLKYLAMVETGKKSADAGGHGDDHDHGH